MLQVMRVVPENKRAADAAVGSVQTFLEHLLVEVIAANYRHFLHESIIWSRGDRHQALRPEACSPPLLASERQLSGLLSSAIGTFAPVSWPEMKVSRLKAREHYDEGGEADGRKDVPGRADFVAGFGSRLIGLEFKRAAMTFLESDRKHVQSRWTDVRKQAGTVVTRTWGGSSARIPSG